MIYSLSVAKADAGERIAMENEIKMSMSLKISKGRVWAALRVQNGLY